MKNFIEFLKKIFKFQPKSYELVEGLKANNSLSNDQTNMLGNLLKLGNIQVVDIMVPRADIVALSASSNLNSTLSLFLKASHSRIPVYSEQLDNIVGMIHVKDLLNFWKKNEAFSINKIKRNVLFASPSMLVNDLLGQMRATRTHLAIIVDEHGGTDGLVTIEDLVEEIVGEIEDEHDSKKGPMVTSLDNGAFLVNARALTSDLERALGLNFSHIDAHKEVDTVGGLIFTISGKIPNVNEVISHPKLGLNFKILEADNRRINKVLVSRSENIIEK
ncbi:MAG: Hemolysin C [Alphaproteobacteria bacterium MarineAlpha9_Bin4]|nr:magnesium/cobalt efflux protein [Pelagibacterales bacterium]PPR26595.1 MAG: Hemolysin C [Alphaproteobacteria bacterium MarineAlpha9_Bin4]|tara:strand:+ start:449 stop:1273 length:825 start_codon:yes stop_codon:yes gene_type:complete